MVHNALVSSKPSFVASCRLACIVKKINKKFNKIAKRKNDLGLQTIDVGSSSSSQHELMMMNKETDSLVVPENWKIVGRVNDKSTIIKMLLEEEEEEEENSNNNQGDGGKNVSVIPIVGMGGLGKTTIAQQVYNDEAVQKHFELKIWICVSDPFDIEKLWKNIASFIGGIDKVDIARSLQNAFKGKKFILVFDDVWNEKPADWNNFKKPFMVGREGSKILVTTRNEKVALIMVDKFKPYLLGILKENDCWSLFKEIAFGCAAAGAVETPKLVEIGKEMVKRCGGLRLAVIFLGSLMRSKKEEEEWKIIRDTKFWHESREGKNYEILRSLRLSYDYLPSHLKVCFSYCCLFPKDWIINKEKLIQLWMAEGFLIESPRANAMSMEEIGNEYFHSLLSSFFFQDLWKDEDGDIATFKMHDLVHDLACSVVGKNECLIVENAHDIGCISKATRRLNLLVDLDDKEMLPIFLKVMKKAKNLRTVIVCHQSIRFDYRNAFKENKRLRVLDFSGYHSYYTKEGFRFESKSTSSSIGGLKHLRYVAVSGGEVLFPKGIGRLSFLQTLSEFDVGDKKKNKNATGGIEELEGLNHLRGDLIINHLENVTSETDACRANLKEKKNLRGLKLGWFATYPFGCYIANNNDEAVLEGLRPHPNLRDLGIGGFKLPRWIEDSSCLPNLVTLRLDGNYIEQVAGFGGLPSLRSLTLGNMYKLKCIGNEFYYSTAASGEAAATTTIAFPSLKKLTLRYMPSLEEWVVPVPPPCCFPLLEEIAIDDCPHLTTITPTTTIFPCLKVLSLNCIDENAVKTLVTNNLNSLTSLRLYKIHNLITLPRQGLIENNNTLLSLEIILCKQFEGFFPPNNDDDDQEGISSSSSCSSLQFLTLFACPALRFLPNFRSLTSLRKLKIQECKESMSLLNYLSSSSSSLEHLEHVTVLNKNERLAFVVSEWRKSTSF